jgi:hypothetical protein
VEDDVKWLPTKVINMIDSITSLKKSTDFIKIFQLFGFFKKKEINKKDKLSLLKLI